MHQLNRTSSANAACPPTVYCCYSFKNVYRNNGSVNTAPQSASAAIVDCGHKYDTTLLFIISTLLHEH